MGIYLNPGSGRFEICFRDDIHIDKSGMIRYLNSVVIKSQRYINVSRPRRFGKTMAADMICAYYDRTSDSRGLFEGQKLSDSAPLHEKGLSWDVYLNNFDVIRLVMTDFLKKNAYVEEALSLLQKRILGELEECYPNVKYDPSDLIFSMDKF